MNQRFYVARLLFLGLIASQILATLQIHFSNAALYQTILQIKAEGYLTIPSGDIAHTLRSLSTALIAGFYITISLGALISVITIAGVLAWDRLFDRNNVVLFALVILWAGLLVAVNFEGLNLMITAYVFLIPLVIFAATLLQEPAETRDNIWLKSLLHFLFIGVLTALWITQIDNQKLKQIRELAFFSNPLGTRLGNLYYQYYLYPANIMLPVDQKIMKTARLRYFENPQLHKAVQNAAIKRGYLIIRKSAKVDLEIKQRGNILTLAHQSKAILHATPDEFLTQSDSLLAEFSRRIDTYRIIRTYLLYAVVIAVPISLYILLYALVRILLRTLLGLGTSSTIAAIVCFGIGLAIFAPVYMLQKIQIESEQIGQALQSEQWQERIAGLKNSFRNQLDIQKYIQGIEIFDSPHALERYWFVKNLAQGTNPKDMDYLVAALDDSNIGVSREAYRALSLRGNRATAQLLYQRIQAPSNWFDQWCAYNALSTLGWRQQPKPEVVDS